MKKTYIFPDFKNQYRIVIVHSFCHTYKPFQTLYLVNIDLKLEWPINVRRYFDSSKVRGEENSVIFINLEIFPGPEVSHFSNDSEEFQ